MYLQMQELMSPGNDILYNVWNLTYLTITNCKIRTEILMYFSNIYYCTHFLTKNINLHKYRKWGEEIAFKIKHPSLIIIHKYYQYIVVFFIQSEFFKK